MGLCTSSETKRKNTASSNHSGASPRTGGNLDNSNNNVKPNDNNTGNNQNANTNSQYQNNNSKFANRISQNSKFDDINKYFNISEVFLGKGATGMVREGTDKRGEKFAIKTVWKADIEQNECFKREIDINLELNHESIVRCLEVYEDPRAIHLVLQEVTGGDLFDHIIHSRDRKLTEKEAMDILHQILNALNYLHVEVGIVHRDIKPENFLMYNEKGRNKIKLIDFGFAKKCKPDETMTEQLGTPLYAAPEIFLEKPYTNKVDLWSTGVVLYNMVNGLQPFSSKMDQLKEQVLEKEIDFSGFKNNSLKSLCKHLLDRDPDKRYSAIQALESLKLIEEGDENQVTVPANFRPDMNKILFILNCDRSIIEEMKNIFIEECDLKLLNNMWTDICSRNAKDQNNNRESNAHAFTNKSSKSNEINNNLTDNNPESKETLENIITTTNVGILDGKQYVKADVVIDFAENYPNVSPNFLQRLNNFKSHKGIEKIKKQMINLQKFFITLIESLRFIRKLRALNIFKKIDSYDMGFINYTQLNNYFIDPIQKKNIKIPLNINDKYDFEKFYQIYNQYDGIQNDLIYKKYKFL